MSNDSSLSASRGDERRAREMLDRSPDLFERAPKSMVLKASGTGRIEAVRLALDLGFDPNYVDEVTALHDAAGRGRQDIVRLPLDRGASLSVREPFYDGTPLGWADFFDQAAMREMLLNEAPILSVRCAGHRSIRPCTYPGARSGLAQSPVRRVPDARSEAEAGETPLQRSRRGAGPDTVRYHRRPRGTVERVELTSPPPNRRISTSDREDRFAVPHLG